MYKNNSKIKCKKVAVIYHYWAHYRDGIASALCSQKFPNPEYILFSDKKSNTDIKTIDINRSEYPVDEGGLKWRFIRNTWIGKYFLWQHGMVRLSLSKEFDTIIYLGQMYFISTWIGAAAARVKGKRVLMWTHGCLRDNNSLKEIIRAQFYKLSHGLLLYGNRAKNILEKKGFKPENLYVVYNSMDYNRQLKYRNKLSSNELLKLKKTLFKNSTWPIIYFVGRLNKRKKLDYILQAAAKLKSKKFDVNVLFVGNGHDKKRLKTISNNLKLTDRVTFYGACYDESELARLISISDLCVSPGEIGLATMHSMMYGTPVLTHSDPSFQMPEYEAVVDGVTGKFFKIDDIDDLSFKIKNWFENNTDRNAIRMRCQKLIDIFYNPNTQIKVFNGAVFGKPAQDIRI